MTEPRLPSNHLVTRINTSIIAKLVLQYCAENNIDMDSQVLDTNWKWGIVEKNGQHYLLCSEGVGSGVSLDVEKDKIPWYRTKLDEKGKTVAFDMFPFVESHFDYPTLQEWDCIEENKEYLHEFVRVHNQRVEDNYTIWQRFLDGVRNSV
jgi:hypothetical protein